MGGRSRRSVLAGAGTALALALSGCSDEDDPAPGLHAVNVLTLHREGDRWYDFPAEAGVQVTVENTDVDRHEGTLVVTLEGDEDGDGSWTQERSVNLPGGTTRGYRIVFEVGASREREFTATASIRPA